MRMVGTGEVTVVPDQLTFTLSVTEKQPGLDQALAGSSATMDRVLARLKAFGIKEGDVQTTGLQMYCEYDYPLTARGSSRGTGSRSVLGSRCAT